MRHDSKSGSGEGIETLTGKLVCKSCSATGLSAFYKTSNHPVHSCVLTSTREKALEFPKGEIALGFCDECGFISNLAFDPSKVDYSQPYEDQQSFSQRFNVFAQGLAGRLIEKYSLYDKHVVEIGCGKGDFFALLGQEQPELYPDNPSPNDVYSLPNFCLPVKYG